MDKVDVLWKNALFVEHWVGYGTGGPKRSCAPNVSPFSQNSGLSLKQKLNHPNSGPDFSINLNF